MKINISHWETKNLRVPDMRVELKDGLNFIQIPNGGGKTTIQELIKAVLTNSVNKYKNAPHGILELADKNHPAKEGTFELGIDIKSPEIDERVVFHYTFKFFDDVITPYTTTSTKGKRSGWRPPKELEIYLNDEHVNVFMFPGDKLDPYFSSSDAEGLPVHEAIDTFSGIRKIENTIDIINDAFQSMHSESKKTNQSTTQKKLKELRRHQKELIGHKEKLQKDIEILNKEFRALDEKSSDGSITLVEDKQQKVKEQIELNQEIRLKESNLNIELTNPFNFSAQLSNLLKSFLKNLNTAKLPGYASEFFKELVDHEDHCICGEELTAARKDSILDRQKKYLGPTQVDTVNKFKNEIEGQSRDSSIENIQELLKELKTLNDNKQAVERSIKRIEQNIHKKTLTEKEINRYKELQDLIKRRTDSKDKLDQKSLSLKILKKLTITQLKNGEIPSIPDCNSLIKYYENEAAEAGGYAKALEKKNKFTEAVDAALNSSYSDYCKEVKDSINKKISDLHHDQTFRIESIDQAINIKGASGASGAQKVITVTSFASTLLSRSNINFPLLIDHPVTPVMLDSRAEISQMLKSLKSQVICLVIDSEKECFITERKKDKLLTHVRNSNFVTVSRTDSGISLGINVDDYPNTVTTKNGVTSNDKNFFMNFHLEQIGGKTNV